ncbi:HDOD domain-containing protein [Rheinheimera maricola]|uniref:HDOD domain-containing protein n=1 Tax=Rheinheimera maricola TaxID=2793282 RepID=A0ABS7X7F3_9GAMM|nr:HDOD domain-containing protein [Rheinheimera maricola]MBZ9611461.1 HDOD domain-containing protein [Rheinheimera maricola]
MTDVRRPSAAQWTEQLAKRELPAITSMATTLDKFANDDVSSIPQLSQAILHDQALSSCLLKVVNTTSHASVRRVNTVSRAAIILGIQAVKNICLTSKILEALLQSENLQPAVYERLLMLMANAFYAGLLARMMLPEHHEDTKEEVYLAAMLYHIGETAFWSSGSALSEQLIRQASALSPAEFGQYCRGEIGVSFDELSIGLVRTWNLGELLLKALDAPESRTVEMQAISLANQLSAAIHTPPRNKADFSRLLQDVARVMKIEPKQLKERIKQTRQLALELLQSYGADVLQSHIKNLPSDADFIDITPVIAPVSRDSALLQVAQQLQQLTLRHCNINELLSLLLQQAAAIFAFDSCAFWILSADKTRLESRSAYDGQGTQNTARRSVAISATHNLFSLSIQQAQPLLINDRRAPQWHNYIDEQMDKLLQRGTMALTSVKIHNKVIGIISAQHLKTARPISDEDYRQFCFICDYLNMCLSLSTAR